MACFGGSRKGKRSDHDHHEKCLGGLKGKIRALQEEVKAVICEREKEVRAYEREMVVCAFKEAEWKQERKKLKKEVRRLRKAVEQKEEKIREIKKVDHRGMVVVGSREKLLGGDWGIVMDDDDDQEVILMEERTWRDEAVDKWKKLYLAIKTELDDLIHITHHGGDHGLYLRAEEEEMVEALKMEVKAKEETIGELKARLAMAEREAYKRAREADILRQSLRIVSSKKTSSLPLRKPKLALIN